MRKNVPATRRKQPDYFNDRDDLRIEWSARIDSWKVGHFCGVLRMWCWEACDTSRIGAKLEAEAMAAASKLVRLAAKRQNDAANIALKKQHDLNVLALRLEGKLPGVPRVGAAQTAPFGGSAR